MALGVFRDGYLFPPYFCREDLIVGVWVPEPKASFLLGVADCFKFYESPLVIVVAPSPKEGFLDISHELEDPFGSCKDREEIKRKSLQDRFE